MDEEARRRGLSAINRLLRGETTEWTSPAGTRYRRFWHEGREYWEQQHADGGKSVHEITPQVRALFLESASRDDVGDLEALFRGLGMPLPGDPKAPRKN